MKAPVEITSAPDPDQVERLASGFHHDPHSLLGVHRATDATGQDRLVVRAWRPDAVLVDLLTGGERHPMHQLHHGGLFAAVLPGPAAAVAPTYAFEATYPDGATVGVEDPYRFVPTMGELDLHLFAEGRHEELWRHLGAHVRTHQGVTGTSFAVWAPSSPSVRVVGDFNGWDGRVHPMRSLGTSGVWELFVPGVGAGTRYKFEVARQDGSFSLRADPFAFACELPPATASIVTRTEHEWQDAEWMARREGGDLHREPISLYECHLGSWRMVGDGAGGWRPLTYREAADVLPQYVAELGFTHVEFLPIAEHPYTPSWGYQVTGYYAPTARFGTPDDFRHLVDRLHAAGIGVLVDWVSGHFPRDEWALAGFDGTALYEHDDPRLGAHPDWGTLVFNYGRHEVRNFLMANALFWVEEFHLDGLRVDAVASMLYLDYSRKAGEWIPNIHGGRENLEAISFIQEVNATVYRLHPSAMIVAEESTSWPAVSRPTYLGGLGFGFKWNMGWMNDTLEYFSKDPIHRRFHHHDLTFALLYAFTENFFLPLSHDEVSHGKGSLLAKMPGDRWQQFANLRALYGLMWSHPGRPLLFMGAEFAQNDEWDALAGLDWHLAGFPEHQGVQSLVHDLNAVYRREPALWRQDFEWTGFSWIDPDDSENSVLSFIRHADGARDVMCLANLTPVVRHGYRIGMPAPGRWTQILSTDDERYGGSGVAVAPVATDPVPWHGREISAAVTLPPLAVVWLARDDE